MMRDFLGILCESCHVYFRIYKTPKGDRYFGRCPKCYRSAQARVDKKSGTKQRFFKYR